MKCITLSLENLNKATQEWAGKILIDYSPDLIIYVAKAGFLIGKGFSETMECPMIGVETVREKGNGLKSQIAPLIGKLPLFVRNMLISIELKSGVHKKNDYRKVNMLDEISQLKTTKINKILVVDDSVDTGNSILAVKNYISTIFRNAEIRVAGLNVWDMSKEKVFTDYALYTNTIIKAPMSKDSKEYDVFMKIYNNYRNNQKEDI